MITEMDLQEAISECMGQRNPTANTCIKLAAFLTIKEYLYPDKEQPAQGPEYRLQSPGYSYAPAPERTPAENTITFDSGSEFATSIDGKRQGDIWPVLDEFVSTVQIVNKPLYNALIRKLNE